MAESTVVLNQGTGGSSVASWLDVQSRQHQEVIVQTQGAGGDPVNVGSSNPMPTQTTGDIASGSADGTSNPVKVGGVYRAAGVSLSDGNRGDLQLDADGNIKVNIVAGAAAGGTSSTFSAAFPAPGTAVGASDGTNMKPFLVDGSGNLRVNISAGGVAAQTDNSAFTAGAGSGLAVMGVYNDAMSNLASGDAGVPRMTADRALYVSNRAASSGGWSPYKLISANSTNATSVKATPGALGSIICGNVGAAVAYLKLYNKASAPTVGADTPVHVIMIPGNTAGAGFSYNIASGLVFSTGIAFAITGAMADSDTTAVALNQVCVNLGYL